MSDKMCSMYKKAEKDMEKYLKKVGDGTYVCKKCGRFAQDKKNLCKPLEVGKQFSTHESEDAEKQEIGKLKDLNVDEFKEILRGELEACMKKE